MDIKNKLTRGPYLDCYDFIDGDLNRHIVVLKDTSDKSPVIVNEKYLLHSHPDIHQSVVVLSGDLYGNLTLAGNIDLEDVVRLRK